MFESASDAGESAMSTLQVATRDVSHEAVGGAARGERGERKRDRSAARGERAAANRSSIGTSVVKRRARNGR